MQNAKVMKLPKPTVDRWPIIGFGICFVFTSHGEEDVYLRVGLSSYKQFPSRGDRMKYDVVEGYET